jgi:hypothetical protein
MTIKHLLAGAAVAALMVVGTAAKADIVIGQETSGGGFVGNLLEQNFPGTSYLVASDGEASFDPFGAGFDTSDGINFSGVPFVWDQAADSIWTSLGNQTWVLPANLSGIGCGVENGTTCEPTGHFISPSAWNPLALGQYLILEADGSVSDRIVLSNNADGTADLKFYSDPNPGVTGVPEPAMWTIMLTGFFGLGSMLRRRKAALA